MQVSVIIPNYNHARFLDQRIQSVLGQLYQDFEIIILDDHSGDDSRAVIARYENHPKVSAVVYNEVNSGSAFKQWQKGIDLAKGKYIWIAESDDWCSPVFLGTVMAGMEAAPDIVLGYVQSYCVDAGDNIKWQSRFHKISEIIKGRQFINYYLLGKNAIFNASMALFKKECIRKVDRRFVQFKFCGDWFFWIQVARQGNVFVSGQVLNFFRKHDADISSRMYRSGYNYREELEILKFLHAEMSTPRILIEKALFETFCRYKKAGMK